MKCPKCRKKTDVLYGEQKYSTTAYVELDSKESIVSRDLEAGYTLLDEWLNNMLAKDGKPKILGCPSCMNGDE